MRFSRFPYVGRWLGAPGMRRSGGAWRRWFGLLLMAGQPGWVLAEPMLLCRDDAGAWREVVAVSAEGLDTRDGPRVYPGGDGVAARLEGEIGAVRQAFLWSPPYTIRRAGNRASASISLKQSGAGDEPALNTVWPKADRQPAALIMAWLVEGRVSAAKVVAVDPAGGVEKLQVVLDLAPEAARRGVPGLLLWQDGRWMQPKRLEKRWARAPLAAIMWGDVAGLEMALDEGVNPLAEARGGQPLLTYAAEAGDPRMVRRLLERLSERQRRKKEFGVMAGYWAAAKGRLEAVRLLVESGIPFQGYLRWGAQPLVSAVERGHLEVATLLAAFASPTEGKIAAEIALTAGHLDWLNTTMAAHPEWEFDRRERAAALFAHVEGRRLDAVQWLLDRGAQWFEDRVQPRFASSSEKITQARGWDIDQDLISPFSFRAFLRRSSTTDPVPEAPVLYTTSVFSLVSGRSLELPDGSVRTTGTEHPLVVAAQNRDEAMVALLLSHGVDVNVRGADGQTALMAAAALGCRELVPRLLEAGADVGAKTDDGWGALHFAALGDDVRVLETLVKAGADPSEQDAVGLSPLLVAWGSGAYRAAGWLLQQDGAALVVTDEMGSGLAERAIAGDQPNLLAALMKQLPDVRLRGGLGLRDAVRLARATRCGALLDPAGRGEEDPALLEPEQARTVLRLRRSVGLMDGRRKLGPLAALAISTDFVVDTDGTVRLARVDPGLPPEVRIAALQAIEAFEFEPVEAKGARRWVRGSFTFELPGGEADGTEPEWQHRGSFLMRTGNNGAGLIEYTHRRDGTLAAPVLIVAEDLREAAWRWIRVQETTTGVPLQQGIPASYRWQACWY